MYRTSIQLYIFPHMVTEPQYRDTVIQRDTARYSDTAIQRDTPIHMYHHPSELVAGGGGDEADEGTNLVHMRGMTR